MKLKIQKKKNYKLIKLALLKSKIFKPQILKLNISNISLQIKKFLAIIYKFHLANKKIYFFGISEKIFLKYQKLLNNSNHLFFPQSYWKKGLLVNKTNIFKYLRKKINSTIKNKNLNKKISTYFLLTNKPDLIVILNNNNEETKDIINETNKLKIPTIIFNEKNIQFSKYISTNIQKENKKNEFYFAMIYSILKKIKV